MRTAHNRLAVSRAIIASLLAVVLAGSAVAADCAARCVKLENDCRRQSQGTANCDAIAAQCYRTCRAQK